MKKKHKLYLSKDKTLWVDLGKHGICHGDRLLIKAEYYWSVDKDFLEQNFKKLEGPIRDLINEYGN